MNDQPQPIPGELNPDHPVTNEMREQWHKIVALLMMQRGETEVEITLQEIQAMTLAVEPQAVVIEEKGDRLLLRLVSMAEAQRLASLGGGRLQ